MGSDQAPAGGISAVRNGAPAYSVEQLDLLRGLAIVLMIVNHTGVGLLDPDLQQHGPLAALMFLGSFAPVVFFFTTGFGVGVGRRMVDLSAFGSTLLKAGLLVVADQFMFWRKSIPGGVDFLGFIALSSVLVTAIGMSKRPVWLCAGLIFSVLVLRFGFGPWIRTRFDLHGVAAWFVGVTQVEPYPFSPWIVYPLLGFLLARCYLTAAGSVMSFLWPWPSATAICALVLAAVLYRAHFVFFRWGAMSIAFFVLSVGVGYICVLLAWMVASRWSFATRLLSLRGIASLAVVPIHYALIELLVASGVAPLGGFTMPAAAAGITTLSLLSAKVFANGVRRWISRVSLKAVWYPLVALVALCAGVTWMVPRRSVMFAAFVIGQLAVTALLATRVRQAAAGIGTDGLKVSAGQPRSQIG